MGGRAVSRNRARQAPRVLPAAPAPHERAEIPRESALLSPRESALLSPREADQLSPSAASLVGAFSHWFTSWASAFTVRPRTAHEPL